MPIRVDLLPLEPATPGQARLTVKKWQGADSHLEFSIQRNQDGYFLQQGKQWSESAFWFKVASLAPGNEGEGLETLIGAEVVDPLLEGSHNSNFRIELREQGQDLSDFGVIRPAAGLLPSSAGGATRSSYEAATLTPPAPEIPAVPETPAAPELELPEPAAQEPLAEPVAPLVEQPAPAVAPPRKTGRVLPLAIGLLVALVLAVGVWFWLQQKGSAPLAATAAAPVAQPVDGPCTLDSMASQNELSFVQNCIKQAPASAALLEIIATAKANQHCGIAQRLYANRAQAGDIEIALAYAHEYDPAAHSPSDCFREPDPATAAYWYETVLSYAPDHAEAKQRLQELQP